MIVLWVVDTACLVFQAGSMKLFGLGLCLSHHSPAAAAGLLLSTVWQEISKLTAAGTEQQMQAASCLQRLELNADLLCLFQAAVQSI